MKKFEEIKQEVSDDIRTLGQKTRVFARNTVDFMVENREAIAFAAPIILGAAKGVKTMTRSVNHKIDLKREQEHRDKDIFDHSLGMWIRLKRKLTPKEQVEIERRRANGEKLCTILSSMNLMK